MANIIFVKFDNKAVASYYVAAGLYKCFKELKKSKNMVLGTATGQTPVMIYQELIKLVNTSKWFKEYSDKLILRQLDNYISPEATEKNLPEYSYEIELKNSIWKVQNGGTFIPKEYAKDPEAEAKKYAQLIKEQNTNAQKVIQLLGIGDEDGHIAFNMPGDAFDSTVHVVELNQETNTANAEKFFGGDETKVPKMAITTGIGEILKSDVIILAAFGKKKANILWKSFFEDPTTDIPASALQTINDDQKVIVVLDEESASVIEEKEGNVFTTNTEDLWEEI